MAGPKVSIIKRVHCIYIMVYTKYVTWGVNKKKMPFLGDCQQKLPSLAITKYIMDTDIVKIMYNLASTKSAWATEHDSNH